MSRKEKQLRRSRRRQNRDRAVRSTAAISTPQPRKYAMAWLIGTLIAITFVLGFFGKSIVGRVLFYSKTQKFAAYEPEAGQVVLDTDSKEQERLLKLPGYQTMSSVFDPKEKAVIFSPDLWRNHPFGIQPSCPVFFRRMRNAKGDQRLVSIVVKTFELSRPVGNQRVVYLQARSMAVPDFLSAPPEMDQPETLWQSNPRGSLLVKVRQSERLRLFAGRLDPRDPSKFTIDLSVDDKSDQMLGQLQDDGTVTLLPQFQGKNRIWIPACSELSKDLKLPE